MCSALSMYDEEPSVLFRAVPLKGDLNSITDHNVTKAFDTLVSCYPGLRIDIIFTCSAGLQYLTGPYVNKFGQDSPNQCHLLIIKLILLFLIHFNAYCNDVLQLHCFSTFFSIYHYIYSINSRLSHDIRIRRLVWL